MTYNPNIPIGSNLVSSDISSMQTNFSQANTIFGSDHFDFTIAPPSNRGLHKQVNFPTIPTPPVVATTASALYPKLGSGVTRLFFVNATEDIQITGASSVTATPAADGYTTLPGGLILQWKVSTNVSSGNHNIVFPLAFPTATLSVMVTANAQSAANTVTLNQQQPSAAGPYQLKGFDLTNAYIRNSTSGSDIYIFAIGI